MVGYVICYFYLYNGDLFICMIINLFIGIEVQYIFLFIGIEVQYIFAIPMTTCHFSPSEVKKNIYLTDFFFK